MHGRIQIAYNKLPVGLSDLLRHTPMAASQRRGPSALPPPRERLRPDGPPAKAEGMSGLADAAEAFRFREEVWTGTCQRFWLICVMKFDIPDSKQIRSKVSLLSPSTRARTRVMSTRGLTTGRYLVDVSLENQTALDDLRQDVMDLDQCERMSGCADCRESGRSERGVS